MNEFYYGWVKYHYHDGKLVYNYGVMAMVEAKKYLQKENHIKRVSRLAPYKFDFEAPFPADIFKNPIVIKTKPQIGNKESILLFASNIYGKTKEDAISRLIEFHKNFPVEYNIVKVPLFELATKKKNPYV